MPHYPVMQSGFNAGEWSPRMFGRTDLDRYPYAVKTMLNFLPRPQGPVTRRSGTRYVANTDGNNESVLIPFSRDPNTSYIIEATEYKFRFYRAGALINVAAHDFTDSDVEVANDFIDIDRHCYYDEQGPFRLTTTGTLPAGLSTGVDYYIVYQDWDDFGLSLTPGGAKVDITGAAGGGVHTITPVSDIPLVLPHTYTLEELKLLDYAPSIDILFLAQQSHPPAELRRYSDAEWRLIDVDFTDGPYGDINRTSTTLTTQTGASTVTASSTTGINGDAGFNSDDEGRHIWIRKDDDAGVVWWAEITSIVSTTVVNVTFYGNPVNGHTSVEWRLGAFYVDNYPACVTFFEQRLVYAGTPDSPESLWASRVADFNTFSPVLQTDEGDANEGDVLDDNALSFTLAISDDIQYVRWVKATRQLLGGCSGGIATVQASSLREPLTPTNINAFLSSNYGVKQLRPIGVEEGVVYLGANGKRLFQSEYVSDADTFRSEELSIRAEHIMGPGADRMAYAKDPDSIIWVRKTDGSLAAMTFVKVEEVLGWSRHTLGGTFEDGDAVVDCIAAVPTPDEDYTELWLSVKRTVNGSTVRTVEYGEGYFTTLGGETLRDAYMVDCGLSYDSPIEIEGATAADPVVVTVPAGHGLMDGDRIQIEDVQGMTDINGWFVVNNPGATTFELHDEDDVSVDGSGFDAWLRGGEIRVRVTSVSGLDHLEGEDVQVLADGAYRGEFTVTSGAVAFGEPAAAVVHAGLGYVSDLVLLPPNYQAMQASSQGKLKRTAKVVLRLDESAGGLCGEEGNILDAVIRRTVDDPLGEPVALRSDDIVTDVEMRWGRRAHLQIRQDLPMPFTVCAVMLDALQDQA